MHVYVHVHEHVHGVELKIDINDFNNGKIRPPEINDIPEDYLDELDNELKAQKDRVNRLREARGFSGEVYIEKTDVDRLKNLGYM